MIIACKDWLNCKLNLKRKITQDYKYKSTLYFILSKQTGDFLGKKRGYTDDTQKIPCYTSKRILNVWSKWLVFTEKFL